MKVSAHISWHQSRKPFYADDLALHTESKENQLKLSGYGTKAWSRKGWLKVNMGMAKS